MRHHRWGPRSQAVLATAHPALVALADRVLELAPFDVSATEGHRTREAHEALPAGATQVTWERSKHSRSPSWALHLDPYPIQYEDDRRYYVLHGVVLLAAEDLGLRDVLRWGGDWDRDLELIDETFRDLAHYELTAEPPPLRPVREESTMLEALKPLLLKIFGKENPWTSLTFYGALLLLFGDSIVAFLCSTEFVQLFGDGTCVTASGWNENLGVALGFIGLRRANATPPTA